MTHPKAINLIKDRIGSHLKTTFLSKLCTNEANILEVRSEYDDGIRRIVKNILQDLSEKLEYFYNTMDREGAPLTDEVLITEAKKICERTFIALT